MTLFFRQIGSSSNHMMYRQIQVLEIIFNNYLKNRITPLVLTFVPLLQMFSQYLWIKYHDNFPPPVLLLFIIVSIDSLVANVFISTLASWVLTNSESVVNLLRMKAVGLVRKSLLRKQIKSYPLLKIKFGSNFVDRLTPFVIQSTILSQTASLLLIKT
jgi:hypothetical protein